MAYSKPGHRSVLSRTLAALILTGIYCFSIIGVSTLLVGASSTSAFARGEGRGGGRGGGRGYSRGGRGRGHYHGHRGRGYGYGRGRGYGYGGGYSACYYVAGVRVCP